MNSLMLVFAIRILEGMFVVGMLGCILVLILSGIDDLRVLFGRDDAPAMNPANNHPTGHSERAP